MRPWVAINGTRDDDLSHLQPEDGPNYSSLYESFTLILHLSFTMILQRISLFIRAAGTTFIPRLIPLLYAALAWLTISGASEVHLAWTTRAGAVVWACMLWVLDGYIAAWLSKRFKWFEHKHNTMMWRMIAKLHNKIKITSHPLLLAALVAWTTRSAIPDILIIRSVRHKLPFWMFLVATITGKLFVYTPIIYGVEFTEYLVNLLG